MAEDSPFDLATAPFRVSEGATPQDVAREMVASFAVVSGLRDKATRSFRTAMMVAGLRSDAPLFRAGDALAEDIDRGVGDGAGNPYHNSQHFCEVLLSALYLSLLAALPVDERARLLAAALTHDFHHDGRACCDTPFRLERLAAAATMPYLEAAGVPAGERDRIACLIRATESTKAAPFVRRCYGHFFGGSDQPPVPEGEPRLAVFTDDARLTLLAVLLAEADVLPSVGLTVEHAELSQANIAREWGKSLGPADKLDFLERMFGEFTVSRFLSPNLERLKQAMRDKAQAA
jgi:hypothetical protein